MATAAAAPAGTLGGGRVEELAEELVRCVQDAQAQFARERDCAFLEFEAGRVQLHTEYSQKLLETDKELQFLQEERALLHEHDADAVEVRQNDVVHLNVGGRAYTVKRETLCICEGSFLAELFSGRWERSMQRDSSGNIFLDFDPSVFELLLAWLRDKKIETPDRPAPPPSVPKEDLQHFQVVADYLGLRPYLDLPGLGPDGWAAANRSAPPTLSCRPSAAATVAGGGRGGSAGTSAAAAREPQGSFLEAAGSFLASWRGGSSSSTSGPGPAAAGGPRPDGTAAPAPAAAPAGGKPVGWSQRFAHPSARRGEGGDAIATVAIGDTRPQATAAAVRATRGYQSGVHYWEVKVLVLSDISYIGFASSEWTGLHMPVGHAPGSWSLASTGAVLACGEEVARLRHGFGEGATVGFLLELAGEGAQRTATVIVDGRRHADLFFDLPDTVYPAVSNNRAPAQYSLSCDAMPPEDEAPQAERPPRGAHPERPVVAAAGRSAVEVGGQAYLD